MILILQNNSNVESEQYQEQQAPTTTVSAPISTAAVQPDVPICLSQPDAVGMAIPLTQPSSEQRANIQYKIGIYYLHVY